MKGSRLSVAEPPKRRKVKVKKQETPNQGATEPWYALFRRNLGPAAFSLTVHLLLAVVLGLFTMRLPLTKKLAELVAVLPEEEPLLANEFEVSVEPSEKPGSLGDFGVDLAGASAIHAGELVELTAPSIDETADLQSERSFEAPKATSFLERVAARGPVAAATSGSQGAVDRITAEILRSLEQSPVLVVWFFDQSGSLNRQREAVRQRFSKVYAELGAIEKAGKDVFGKHGKDPLLTGVVAFGENYAYLTRRPTNDLAEIQEAIGAISTDESGVENVFAAVLDAAKKFDAYRKSGKRQVMFVIFSDERGDDPQLLESAIDRCRQREIPVYVVGVPAPFGRQQALIKYDYPDPRHGSEWLPVDQGPETCLPEVINLRFSAGRGADDPLDSGFGPYALSRLCAETGGKYFAVHPSRPNSSSEQDERADSDVAARLSQFFDPNVMVRYQPDYLSPKECEAAIRANAASTALVQAASEDAVDRLGPLEQPRLAFPFQSEAAFANLLSEGQRGAAKLEPKVARLYDTLSKGEAARPLLASPRLQAAFDLAMGRVLALKVRTESYNAMLALARAGMPFTKPESDTWLLRPSDEISVGSVLEKQAKSAKEYLQRVVDNHPGTPWAFYAKRELAEPLGWRWDEQHTGVNDLPRVAANNAPPPPRNDMPRMAPPIPPKPPTPKL